jgi:hypothetical protein
MHNPPGPPAARGDVPAPEESRTLSPSGTLGSKTLIYTSTGGLGNTSVSMNNAGNFAVSYAYTYTNNANSCIGERRYNASGTPLSSHTVVTSVASSTGHAVLNPSVALNDGGKFVVTWLYGPGGTGNSYDSVQARLYTPGSGFGAVFTIEGYDVIYNSKDSRWVSLDDSGQIFTVMLFHAPRLPIERRKEPQPGRARVGEPLGRWIALALFHGPVLHQPRHEVPRGEAAASAADDPGRDLVRAEVIQAHGESDHPDGDQAPPDHPYCHEELEHRSLPSLLWSAMAASRPRPRGLSSPEGEADDEVRRR